MQIAALAFFQRAVHWSIAQHTAVLVVFAVLFVSLSKHLYFPFRTATIDCLTEIASLPPHDIPSQYHPAMQALLVHLVQSLLEIIPPSADLRRAFENGSDEDCLFVKKARIAIG